MDALEDLAVALRTRLIERARAGEAGGRPIEEEVRELVEREAAPLPEADRAALAERVVLLATGLGPLEPLLSDPAVDEVMVNGPGEVYVERGGRIERSGVAFGGEAELMHAIERILAPLGRRVDESSPLCDARLSDGSRVNVVIPPLSLSGPCLTIRRFRRQGFSLRDLVANGTLAPEPADLLALCVAARASVLVSGGTGSGKTTTLNALSGAIPGEERIVTIEDAAELRLRQRHVVRLEARPPNVEGRGEVTIRQLVRNALRMRPDRIVVGEVRGAEALRFVLRSNLHRSDSSYTPIAAPTVCPTSVSNPSARNGLSKCFGQLRVRGGESAMAGQQVDWRQVVGATVHPTQIAILEAVAKSDRLSPVAFNRSGDSVSRVAYHFRALYNAGLLERAGSTPRRGATEHFYRLASAIRK